MGRVRGGEVVGRVRGGEVVCRAVFPPECGASIAPRLLLGVK